MKLVAFFSLWKVRAHVFDKSEGKIEISRFFFSRVTTSL